MTSSGPGFQAGADHIFEPFVTTKANGLGMGLSISRSIVVAHGARLEAVHDPDVGARPVSLAGRTRLRDGIDNNLPVFR